jgi:glycosyltransferase involved in cell wall biosynthesis
MERPRLNILICHIPQRDTVFAVLHEKLLKQIGDQTVEVLINSDVNMSIGQKRNELLFSATGDYVAFIDDDDDVSDDYIACILKAAKTNPDCVGIEGLLVSNIGTFLFKHSRQFQGWYNGVDCFYRTPNHLNPVRRQIAQEIGFPDMNNGEDQIYSDRLARALKTEVYINHPIYFYRKEYDKK